jgi:hypothetical protein
MRSIEAWRRLCNADASIPAAWGGALSVLLTECYALDEDRALDLRRKVVSAMGTNPFRPLHPFTPTPVVVLQSALGDELAMLLAAAVDRDDTIREEGPLISPAAWALWWVRQISSWADLDLGDIVALHARLESALADAGLGEQRCSRLPPDLFDEIAIDTPIQEAADGGQSGRSSKKGR